MADPMAPTTCHFLLVWMDYLKIRPLAALSSFLACRPHRRLRAKAEPGGSGHPRVLTYLLFEAGRHWAQHPFASTAKPWQVWEPVAAVPQVPGDEAVGLGMNGDPPQTALGRL